VRSRSVSVSSVAARDFTDERGVVEELMDHAGHSIIVRRHPRSQLLICRVCDRELADEEIAQIEQELGALYRSPTHVLINGTILSPAAAETVFSRLFMEQSPRLTTEEACNDEARRVVALLLTFAIDDRELAAVEAATAPQRPAP